MLSLSAYSCREAFLINYTKVSQVKIHKRDLT